MIKYDCKAFCGNSNNTWRGYISKLAYSGGHLEISIHLDDALSAVVCKTLSGFFVYFPYYETGFNLPSLFIAQDNTCILQAIFDEKDASTVAYAIAKVGNLLSKPRRKRKTPEATDDELPF